MPAVLPEGLAIAAVLPREDPRDAVVLPVMADGSALMAGDPGHHRADASSHPSYAISHQPSAMTGVEDLVAQLGRSPSIGTGSVRRIAQLTRLFPGASFQPIRGNLDTRLRKLDEGAHHALVLAAAGLRRLGFAARISFALPVEVCVPAPGQGIVAVEVRAGDTPMQRLLDTINDEGAAAALTAERALVEALGGGCQTPVGALASPAGSGTLSLAAVVVALDGSRAVRGQAQGSRAEAANLGARLGAQLLADGAGEILADARGEQGAVEGIQP